MRHILTLLLTLAVATVAEAATVTGTIQDANGDAVTTRVEFWPLTAPLQSGDALIVTGRPVRTTATDGVLSVSLVEGLYQVRIGSYDKIKISVPSGSGSYEIGTLTADGITYIPPVSSGDTISVSLSPTNYTSLSTNLETHLAGIDVALAEAGGAVDLTGTNDLAGTGQLLNADYISSGYMLLSTNITDHNTAQYSGLKVVTTNYTDGLGDFWMGNYPVGLTVAGTDGTMALVGTSEGGHSSVFEHVEVDPTGENLVEKWVETKANSASGSYLEWFYGTMADPLLVATQLVYRLAPSGASVQQGQNAVLAFRDRGETSGTVVYGLGSDDNKMVFRKYNNTDVSTGSTTLGEFDTNGKWWMPSLSVSNNITANNTEAFGGALISTTNRTLAAATVLSPAPYGLVVNGTEGNMALVGGPEGGFSSALDFTEVAEDGSAITDKWTVAKLTSTNANGSELRFVYGPNADVGSNTNKLSIYPNGTVQIPGILDGNSTGTITNLAQLDVGQYGVAGASAFRIDPDSATGKPFGFTRASDGLEVLSINTGGYLYAYGVTSGTLLSIGDVQLYRDAAGTLALRNGANPQEFRFYSTYTDASNYERGSLQADAGVVTLAAESSGTGSADMDLAFKVNGNGAIYAESASGVAGNARGNNAVDLQVSRSAATQVASGENATAVGSLNSALSLRSVAVGYNNYITGSQGSAFGVGNIVTGGEAIAFGNSSSASGQQSVALGKAATATAAASFAQPYSKAYLYGQHSGPAVNFSVSGDAQASRLIARNTTSGTTPADLFLDGSSARLVLPANTSWGFTCSIVGRATDAGTGAEQSAYYKVEGLIKRDGASNTTLVGSVTKTVLAEDDATWDVTVSADDTNEALDISCTGGTGDNVRWVAVIQLVEVGG